MSSVLVTVLFLPLAAAIALLFVPGREKEIVRRLAFGAAVFTFLL